MKIPQFGWQEGYGAETVCRYIETQEEHHRTKSFKEEYLEFLRKSGVEFDERYVW